MRVVSCSSFFFFFAFALPWWGIAVVAYNSPDCDTWPTRSQWRELGDSFSENAELHGPVRNGRYYRCALYGSDAYEISRGNDGICMHTLDCGHEFCDTEYPWDLPAYVAAVQSPEDIAASLSFASEHDIQVTVKTTGHSYTGSSTAKNSLLIWMQHYPKDGNIVQNWQDSCGTTTHDAVIGINGGETWNDVIEAVGEDYHVVTGGGRTVSAAGGWLQGGGLSFSSREYGIGVDNVLEFDVVLANGTMVKADACTNPDLFFALRGGGGGTYGVVTHVYYKLHPATTFWQYSFFLGGAEYALANGLEDPVLEFIYKWLDFWTKISPTLDSRWSGFFTSTGAELLFFGPQEDALETLVIAWDTWYYTELTNVTSEFIENVFGVLPPSFYGSERSSWYEYKGGAAAYNNPDATDPTGRSYRTTAEITSRLIPREIVMEKQGDVRDFLFGYALRGYFGIVNYFLGGKINDVPLNATAVHPAMRRAVFNIISGGEVSGEVLRDAFPNEVTGVCYNHHYAKEPDWREACFGDNYEKLEAIKAKYDPEKRFQCWHCVGYEGEEDPELDDPVPTPTCPTRTPAEVEPSLWQTIVRAICGLFSAECD